MLDIKDIYAAQENISKVVSRTILEKSNTFSQMCNGEVYLKYENQQRTGSFKIRGAYNKIALLSDEKKSRGVIAASAGNHAQGVALAARMLGIKATIVMPKQAPLSKVNATKGYGAEIILHGDSYDDAYEKACEIREFTGAEYIHAFDDYEIIAGQGTIGLEIIQDLPDVDMIVAPIGGGGLLSGIAIAVKSLKPNVTLIGVEAENAASYKKSREAGEIVELKSLYTIADGIAIKRIGGKNFEILNQYVDDVVTVNDEEIANTILLNLERQKQLLEGSGAVSLAAILNKKIEVHGKKVAVVLSGGNIDMNFMSKIIETGLVKGGKNIEISVIAEDKPGVLTNITNIIANRGGNILKIYHNRYSKDIPIGAIIVTIKIETSNFEHGEEIRKDIEKNGYHLVH